MNQDPIEGQGNGVNTLLQSNNAAIKRFLDVMDTINSKNPKEATSVIASAASHLVDVKKTQRNIVSRFNSMSKARTNKRKELERQLLILQNLLFEKKHLQSQLDICKACPTPNLESMSRDELNEKESSDVEGILNKFLCGSAELSFQDPKRSVKISEKLDKELNSRGILKRDLDELQNDLKKRKRLVDQEKAFLKDIPKKLGMIERSSVPLQKFFQSSTSNPTLHLIGSDRKKRLALARTLSGPLYSLFVQLHSHFDNQREESMSLEVTRYKRCKKNTIGVDEVMPDDQVVHLAFSIPDIHGNDVAPIITKRKRVTIEFAFVEKYGLVTAKVIGSQEKITASVLLEEIFPDDWGKWIAQPDKNTHLPGKPYHWCNFIAGLHITHSTLSTHTIHLSTKAVIRELGKRVYANAILTQLISSFEKRKIITHQSLIVDATDLSNSVGKLESWNLLKETNSKTKKTYTVNIKNNSYSLCAHVEVDWCRYPRVLPKWSLCIGKEGWANKSGSALNLVDGTNPLYSSSMGQIESIINSGMKSLVDFDDDSSFNYIISYQLVNLMKLWDQFLQDSSSKQKIESDIMVQTTRSRKGRNRASTAHILT